MARVYLLTGRPGTGKTTLIRKIVSSIKTGAGGFYTEEIRSGGIRQGFKIATLDGQCGILSHIDSPSRARVGKYGVNIDVLDSIGVASVCRAVAVDDLIVIDEIGKMELFSPRFRDAVLMALNSGKKVLGSIMLDHHPFADEVKRQAEVKLIQLNAGNRLAIEDQVTAWLQAAINENND